MSRLAQQHDEQQRKTFLNFVNVYLRDFDRQIEDLTEMHTGVAFFYLLKSIYTREEKDFPLFGKMEERRVRMHFVQKMNVGLVIQHLKEAERIPLHGVSALSIVNKELKIIKALVWCIICHFLVGTVSSGRGRGKSTSPYLNVLAWLNELLVREGSESFQIRRAADWANGRALFGLSRALSASCDTTAREAFIHENEPLTQSDDPEDGLRLVSHCIDFAKEHMSIPDIVTPEEFASAEKKSLTVYLSYFRQREKSLAESLLKGQEEARRARELFDAREKALQDELERTQTHGKKLAETERERADRLDKKCATLQQRIEVLKKTIDDLNETIRKMVVSHEETVQGLQAEKEGIIAKFDEERDRLMKELDTTKERKAELQERLVEERQKWEELLRKTNETHETRRIEWTEQTNELQSVLKAQKDENESLRQEVAEKTASFEDQLRTEKASHLADIETRDAQVALLKKDHAETVEQIQKELADEKEGRERDVSDLQTKLDSVEADLSQSQQTSKDFENRLTEMTSGREADNLTNKTEIDRLNGLLRESSDREEELRDLRADLEQKLSSLQREMNVAIEERDRKLEMTRDELERTRKTLEDRISKKEELIASKQKELDETVAELEGKLKERLAMITELEKNLADEKTARASEVTSLQEEYDSVRKQLEGDRDNLQNRLSKQEQDNADLQSEYDSEKVRLEGELADHHKMHESLVADWASEKAKLEDVITTTTASLTLCEEDLAKKTEKWGNEREEMILSHSVALSALESASAAELAAMTELKNEEIVAREAVEGTLETTREDAQKVETELLAEIARLKEDLESEQFRHEKTRGDWHLNRAELEATLGQTRETMDQKEKDHVAEMEKAIAERNAAEDDLRAKHKFEMSEKDEAHRMKIDDMQQAHGDLQKTLTTVQSDGSAWKAEMSRQMELKDSDLTQERASNEKLASDLADSREEHAEATIKWDRLLQEKDRQISQLEDDVRGEKASVAALEDTKASLEMNLADAVKKGEDDVQAKVEEIRELEKQHAEAVIVLEGEKSDRDDRISTLEGEKRQLEEEVASLAEVKTGLETDLGVERKNLAEAEESIKKHEEEESTLRERIVVLEKDLSDALAREKSLGEEKQTLLEIEASLENTVEERETEIEKMRSEHEKAIAEWTARFNVKDEALSARVKEIEDITSKCEESDRSNAVAIDGLLENLQETETLYQRKLEDLTETSQATEKSLNDQISQLTIDLEEQAEETEELRKTLDDRTAHYEEMIKAKAEAAAEEKAAWKAEEARLKEKSQSERRAAREIEDTLRDEKRMMDEEFQRKESEMLAAHEKALEERDATMRELGETHESENDSMLENLAMIQDAAKKREAALKEELLQLDKELTEGAEREQHLESELDDTRQSHEEELQERASEMESLRKDFETLQDANDELSREKKLLEEQLRDLRSQHEAYVTKAEMTESDLHSKVSDLETEMNEERSRSAFQIETLDSTIASLRGDIEKMQGTIGELEETSRKNLERAEFGELRLTQLQDDWQRKYDELKKISDDRFDRLEFLSNALTESQRERSKMEEEMEEMDEELEGADQKFHALNQRFLGEEALVRSKSRNLVDVIWYLFSATKKIYPGKIDGNEKKIVLKRAKHELKRAQEELEKARAEAIARGEDPDLIEEPKGFPKVLSSEPKVAAEIERPSSLASIESEDEDENAFDLLEDRSSDEEGLGLPPIDWNEENSEDFDADLGSSGKEEEEEVTLFVRKGESNPSPPRDADPLSDDDGSEGIVSGDELVSDGSDDEVELWSKPRPAVSESFDALADSEEDVFEPDPADPSPSRNRLPAALRARAPPPRGVEELREVVRARRGSIPGVMALEDSDSDSDDFLSDDDSF